MISVCDRLEALAVRGLGPAMFRRLVTRFGSWAAARSASVADLVSVAGAKRPLARAICEGRWEFEPDEEFSRAERLGVTFVTDEDEAYPPGLKHLEDAPILLYVRGTLEAADALSIGVVGTRRCSVYGQTQAERLSGGLASAGMTVVSGLARGIDAAAHRGALRAKGRTLAVMGCGLAHMYPPEHDELADLISQSGALVSEVSLLTKPRPTNFPARNRIIASISLGLLVVEAPLQSGALITARFAGELGREIFAVPGEVSRPQSRGCHALIRDGAKIVGDVHDILDEMESTRGLLTASQEPEPVPPRLNPVERAVYETLAEAPKDIDQIVREASLPASNAASALLAMELRGLVRQLPGKRFRRA